MPIANEDMRLRENKIASAHVYGLAGNEPATGAAQEAHDGGDFFRFAIATQRDLAFGVRALAPVGGPLRVNAAGRHTVHADAIPGEFFRKRAREADEPALRRSIVRFAIAAQQDRIAAQRNDVAAALRE